MLTISNLSKKFGKLTVLDDISIDMERGQVVSLIGPNGSGKTTLIKCLLGLVIPDSGEISLDGQKILKNWAYRERIGYMPQIGRYPDNMLAGQVVDMLKSIRNSSRKLDEDLLEAYRFEEFASKPLRTLSGGTRQKVSACLSFLFDPDILILDEPTSGLDPLASEILREKIAVEKARGKLILVTSHILSDLEDITTDVLYLMDGKIRFYESVDALKSRTGEQKLNRAVAQIMKKQA